jgi:translation initiation factor IF-2
MARRPAGVDGRRRTGPRKPSRSSGCSIHDRRPPAGGPPRPGPSRPGSPRPGSPELRPARTQSGRADGGSAVAAEADAALPRGPEREPPSGRGGGAFPRRIAEPASACARGAGSRAPRVEATSGGGPGSAWSGSVGSAPGAGPSASVSGDGAAAVSSRIHPSRDRRARAWYSGPCFRGSAYSLGLIVQYVPLDAPYQVAPVQPGSKGSRSAPSYEVEPGVAVFAGRRPADDLRPRPPPGPLVAPEPALFVDPASPAGPEPGRGRPPGAPGVPGRPVARWPDEAPEPALAPDPALDPPAVGRGRGAAPPGRAPGVRRPSARPEARARFASARHGSRGSPLAPSSARRPGGRAPTRRTRPGPASCS